MSSRFRTAPPPREDVIDCLERLLEAAKAGNVRSIVIVASNQVYEVETRNAGALDGIRRTVLLGGLARAADELMHPPTPFNDR